MSARCEKHAGEAATPAPCNDCQVAESLAEHRRMLDDDANKRPGDVFNTEPAHFAQAREDAIAALSIRRALAGRTCDFKATGAAFEAALQFVTQPQAPMLWEHFLRASRITFLASPAGPTTESMEQFV